MTSNDKAIFQDPYSANADDKTLHELYLWPFYDAVKSGPGSVMCAMNSVNGTRNCENYDVLMKHLKDELGFPSIVTNIEHLTSTYSNHIYIDIESKLYLV
jgi:beta-glucosidase-like glycosyl hydrolase